MKLLSLFIFCFVFLLSLNLTGQEKTVGVLNFDEETTEGYTFFSPSTDTVSYLINNCGELLHKWVGQRQPGRTAFLLDDGSVLRCEVVPTSGAQWGGGTGGRFLRIAWDGSILWDYNYASETYLHHHEVFPLKNGNLLFMAWELKTPEEQFAAGKNPAVTAANLLTEKIVELKPIGNNDAEVVWEWKLWDHLVQEFNAGVQNFGVVADHPEKVDVNFGGVGGGNPNASVDWIHFNAIDFNEELDQIVLSSRAFSEVWIIDHSTTTEEAASNSGGLAGKGGDLLYRWGNPQIYQRGTVDDQQLYNQHNVHWIKEGNPDAGKIAVFNNGVDRPGGFYSSVDVIDPERNGFDYIINEDEAFGPTEANVAYGNADEEFFFGLRTSSCQQQANGNWLICDGPGGNLFEVSPNRELVWEYENPVSGFGNLAQGEQPSGNSVFDATKFPVDHVSFENRDLTPQGVLELDPFPEDCNAGFVGVESIVASIEVYPNPASDFLEVLINEDMAFSIIDVNGKTVYHSKRNGSRIEIQSWKSGMYFILSDRGELGRFIKI